MLRSAALPAQRREAANSHRLSAPSHLALGIDQSRRGRKAEGSATNSPAACARLALRPAFQPPIEEAEDAMKLALHGDHLLAHVQGDFGAFEIDAHVFDQQARHAHPIDLVEGVRFAAATGEGLDQLLALQAREKAFIDFAYP